MWVWAWVSGVVLRPPPRAGARAWMVATGPAKAGVRTVMRVRVTAHAHAHAHAGTKTPHCSVMTTCCTCGHPQANWVTPAAAMKKTVARSMSLLTWVSPWLTHPTFAPVAAPTPIHLISSATGATATQAPLVVPPPSAAAVRRVVAQRLLPMLPMLPLLPLLPPRQHVQDFMWVTVRTVGHQTSHARSMPCGVAVAKAGRGARGCFRHPVLDRPWLRMSAFYSGVAPLHVFVCGCVCGCVCGDCRGG